MPAVSKALVVGGGIGGLCAATALRRAGILVDLVEIKRDWTVYGVGIIQPNNALRALDKLGLATTCVERGGSFLGWRIYDSVDNFLMETPSTNQAAPHFPPVNGITRPILHQILIAAAKSAGTHVSLGVGIDSLTDKGDHVAVTFTDGTNGVYDLVVASDGVYSDMRKRLFGDIVRPEANGQAVYRYNLPRPDFVKWGHLYFGPTNKVGLVPLSPTLMYMLVVVRESNGPLPQERLAELMRAQLKEYKGLIAELRELIVDPTAVVYKRLESLLLPSPWMKGRVVLIGDAAHATTPHLAQGATMAIEDGVLLGELLARDAPLASLLDEFMKRRFDRAKLVNDSSSQIATWELEQWAGIHNPKARPGELLHEATAALMADY